MIKHIDSVKNQFNGIYPCMNYGKKLQKVNLYFLNSGDEFFNDYSLKFFKKYFKSSFQKFNFWASKYNSFKKINWYFPGKD